MTVTAPVCPEPESPRPRVCGDDAESGLATAEYAIVTVAAATFAGILLAVVRGGDIKGMLTSLIQSALTLG